MPVTDGKRLIENRVEAIKSFHADAGIPKAELDLSGGIDSAVMAYLLVKALGPENVILVHTRIDTNPKQTDRATELGKGLECPAAVLDLTDIFRTLADNAVKAAADRLGSGPWYGGPGLKGPDARELEVIQQRVESDPTILGSLRSTLRAPVGRFFNRLFGGGVRYGTGNECEDRFLRFFQKGGDGEVDTNPIEMLSKTEVFQLAFAIAEAEKGTPLEKCFRELITVKPSPDLWGQGDAHNDEDELKSWTGVEFTYGRVDPETGKVLSFGTIERVARLLDVDADTPETIMPYALALFTAETPSEVQVAYDLGLGLSRQFGIFPADTFADEQVLNFLKATRKAERRTRHKSNTNIPTLGTRAELVDAEILSDKPEA